MPSSWDPETPLPAEQLAALGIKQLTSERVYDGWSKLDVLHIRQAYRGADVELEREIHDHGHGVAVLVYDGERRVTWLVRQIRWSALVCGGPARMLEVPAGLIDKAGTPEETARREVLEEIGLQLKSLEFVASPWSTPGAVTERIHLYLGEADDTAAREAGGGLAAEHEDIEIVEMDIGELYRLNDSGQIFDMKTMILTEALRRRIG